MLHSEHNCAHLCSEWSTVGYEQVKLWSAFPSFHGPAISTETTNWYGQITATHLKNGTLDETCSAQQWAVEIWQLWMDTKIVAPAMAASQHSPLYAPLHNTYTFHSHSNVWCIAGLGAKSQYISPENKIQRLQHEKGNYITHKENLFVIRMGHITEQARIDYFR